MSWRCKRPFLGRSEPRRQSWCWLSAIFNGEWPRYNPSPSSMEESVNEWARRQLMKQYLSSQAHLIMWGFAQAPHASMLVFFEPFFKNVINPPQAVQPPSSNKSACHRGGKLWMNPALNFKCLNLILPFWGEMNLAVTFSCFPTVVPAQHSLN